MSALGTAIEDVSRVPRKSEQAYKIGKSVSEDDPGPGLSSVIRRQAYKHLIYNQ
jgi:hypothetical protein